MIHRLPAISICAFSTIVVALPIAMLLNTFTAEVDGAAEAKTVPRITAPAPLPSIPQVKLPAMTDDGGEPVAEETAEKTE